MVCASGSLSSSERTKNFLNANGLFYNHDHPFLDFFIQGIDIKAIEIEAIEGIELKDEDQSHNKNILNSRKDQF